MEQQQESNVHPSGDATGQKALSSHIEMLTALRMARMSEGWHHMDEATQTAIINAIARATR